jgi:hypothetical protein
MATAAPARGGRVGLPWAGGTGGGHRAAQRGSAAVPYDQSQPDGARLLGDEHDASRVRIARNPLQHQDEALDEALEVRRAGWAVAASSTDALLIAEPQRTTRTATQ